MDTFEWEEVVCGLHVYQTIWSSYIGEELVCQQEEGNTSDSYAVAVLNPALSSASSSLPIVGHVPRKMSAACSGFLESGGTIRCTITGPRRYSRDLRQGGIDVPCKYTFTGENPHLSNLARFVKRFSSRPKKRELNNEDPSSKKEETHVQPSKKSKNIPADQKVICVETNCDDSQMEISDEQDNFQPNKHWVTFNRKVLSINDKEIIVKGWCKCYVW